MIKIKNCSFSYNEGKREITNINISIKKGEFVVITGMSGSGKTTVGRIINGLVPHFFNGERSGEIIIDNTNVNNFELWQIGEKVASVFQDPNSQFFAHKVKDEIAFGAENYGIESHIIEKEIEEISKELNITKILDKDMFALSNGQKQKVAIASAVITRPAVYIFDEPSANLDVKSTYDLAEIMKSLHEKGNTIIVVEHRIFYLTGLLNKLIYIQNGEVKKEYSKDEVNSFTGKELKELGIRTNSIDKIQITPKDVPMKEKNILQMEKVKFSYDKEEILKNVNFTVHRGEIIAIVGANGIGKTTLVNILSGLQKENGGKVKFFGKEVGAKKRKKYIDFTMHDANCQLFSESVEEELKLGFDNIKNNESILKKFGLWESREKHPAALSGGQKQRLILALSEKKDKDIMIFDEPTSGLDGKNMRITAEYFEEQAKKGKTIIVITHDYEFIFNCCTKAVILSDGEIKKEIQVCEENKKEIFHSMKN